MIKVKRSDVAAILEAAFPEYTGRKIVIEPKSTITLYNLNWFGGSKNMYVALRSDLVPHHPVIRAPWSCIAEGVEISIPRGTIVVKHIDYCGEDLGIVIYVHPNDMPTWLEAKK